MYPNRDFRQKEAPVKVGDELDVKIEAVGEKGDGIAKKEGFVLFVPNTQQGQEVKIRVTKVLRKVGFAEVVGESSGQPAEEQQESQESQESQEPQEPQEQESYEEEPSSKEPEQDAEDTEDFGEENN